MTYGSGLNLQRLQSLTSSHQEGGGQRWKEFKHSGVIFSPEYLPHNVPIRLKNRNGKEVFLNPAAEELANFYATLSQTEHIKNKIFLKNFWGSWKKTLQKDEIELIQELKNVDFSAIYQHLEAKRQLQSLTKEEKRVLSELAEVTDLPFKSMIVDGKTQPVGNYRVEPPGVFMGRGCNPKTGKVKQRVLPEDISINISQNGTIPTPPNNQMWNIVIHKPDIWWLASWKEPISNKIKSVRLANSSEFKAASDQSKFDLARKLKKKVKSIRDENAVQLSSKVKKHRQLATALYLIDELALRVGNEKGKDETDTVGVSSLRVEHITFLPDKHHIRLDFLGKDSIRFLKDFPVTPQVYRNLKLFTKEKKPKDSIFDRVKSKDINDYLRSFMKGLTSKVFRTYNASTMYQTELGRASRRFASMSDENQADLILEAMKDANTQVAILCNHQKAVSKNFTSRMDRINEQIAKQELKIKLLRKKVRAAKGKGSEKAKAAAKERLDKGKLKLELLKRKKQSTVNLKSISLDTSRTNYIDPRISFAFAKKHRFDTSRFFSTALQQRFEWAQDTKADWKF